MKKKQSTSTKPPKCDRMPWPFVEVHWHDATSESTWKSQQDLPEVSGIVTRGWLVRHTKKSITIASSLGVVDDRGDEEEPDKIDCGEIVTIPRGCVCGDIIPLDVRPALKKKVVLK